MRVSDTCREANRVGLGDCDDEICFCHDQLVSVHLPAKPSSELSKRTGKEKRRHGEESESLSFLPKGLKTTTRNPSSGDARSHS